MRDVLRFASAVSLGLVFHTFASTPAAATSMFTGLGDLPGGIVSSGASAISADGSVVVGRARTDGGDAPFRWTADTGMVELDNLGFPSGWAFAVSDDGSTAAGRAINTSIHSEPVYWNSIGDIVALGFLDCSPTCVGQVQGVSSDGSVIVGISRAASGSEAFRWTAATGMVSLGSSSVRARDASSDGSVVVGYGTQAGPEAFRWTEQEGLVGIGDLPGGSFFSDGYAVTPDGAAIVGVSIGDSGHEPFRWTAAGGIVGLGILPGTTPSIAARGVSADGSIVVGGGSTVTSGDEAFIWDATNGIRLLSAVLMNDYDLDLTGWTLGSANAISADGLTIVGSGRNPNGELEAWLAQIPEPSTALLLGAGLVGLGFSRRRTAAKL